jgi:hypothetical protein
MNRRLKGHKNMSHWTTIKTQVRDVDALRAACRELKLELKGKGLARGYAGNNQEFDLVIPMPDCPYDIGLKRETGGGYSLHTDWYVPYNRQGKNVVDYVGAEFKRLVQLYGVHKATIEARKKGLQVQRMSGANGAIRLSISGGAL